jgi:hypothetical protein
MNISLGYQIPSFTYPGGPSAIFDTVVAQARDAESSTRPPPAWAASTSVQAHIAG